MPQNSQSLPYQKSVQLNNEKKLLKELWFDAPLSRSELAKRCGLNKSTTTYLVSDLLDKNLVLPSKTCQTGVGHPQELLTLNRDYGYLLGARVTSMDVRVAVSDFRAHILYQDCFPIEPCQPAKSILDNVCASVRRGMETLSVSYKKVLGFGFSRAAAPELTEPSPPSSDAVPDFPVEAYLSSKLGMRVVVNDSAVNSARTAKWASRANLNKSIFCIEINKFVGAGALINGSIYTGRSGTFGSLLSHLVLEPGGTPCLCGKRGCWAAVGSLDILGPGITVEDAVQRAEAGDPEILGKFKQIGMYSGRGIAQITRIMNPDDIILSGPIIHARHLISDAMFQAMDEDLPAHLPGRPAVSFSEHDVSAPLMGALLSVAELILD